MVFHFYSIAGLITLIFLNATVSVHSSCASVCVCLSVCLCLLKREGERELISLYFENVGYFMQDFKKVPGDSRTPPSPLLAVLNDIQTV